MIAFVEVTEVIRPTVDGNDVVKIPAGYGIITMMGEENGVKQIPCFVNVNRTITSSESERDEM